MKTQDVIPYICIDGSAAAIDFYKKAFSAVELMREADADGRIRHAQIQIGDSTLMLTDPTPAFPDIRSVQSFGGSGVNLFVYLDDVDRVAAQFVAAGGTVVMELQNQSYGRSGGFKDSFGITWWICSREAAAKSNQ